MVFLQGQGTARSGSTKHTFEGNLCFFKWKCFYKLAAVGESLDVFEGLKIINFIILKIQVQDNQYNGLYPN